MKKEIVNYLYNIREAKKEIVIKAREYKKTQKKENEKTMLNIIELQKLYKDKSLRYVMPAWQ